MVGSWPVSSVHPVWGIYDSSSHVAHLNLLLILLFPSFSPSVQNADKNEHKQYQSDDDAQNHVQHPVVWIRWTAWKRKVLRSFLKIGSSAKWSSCLLTYKKTLTFSFHFIRDIPLATVWSLVTLLWFVNAILTDFATESVAVSVGGWVDFCPGDGETFSTDRSRRADESEK